MSRDVVEALRDLIERSDYYLCQTTDRVPAGDGRAVSPDRRDLADANLRHSLSAARDALQQLEQPFLTEDDKKRLLAIAEGLEADTESTWKVFGHDPAAFLRTLAKGGSDA